MFKLFASLILMGSLAIPTHFAFAQNVNSSEEIEDKWPEPPQDHKFAKPPAQEKQPVQPDKKKEEPKVEKKPVVKPEPKPDSRRPPAVPTPRPERPVTYPLLEGYCFADDDSSFDWIFNLGLVHGNSLPELMTACRDKSWRARRGLVTYGVKHVRIISRVPHSYRKAVCYVDDDEHFDFGIIEVGEITGPSLRQLAEDCQDAARTMYRSGSSGIKEIY